MPNMVVEMTMLNRFVPAGGVFAGAIFCAALASASPAVAAGAWQIAFNTQDTPAQAYSTLEAAPLRTMSANDDVVGNRLQITFKVPAEANPETALHNAQTRLSVNDGNVFALAGNTDGISDATDVIRQNGHIMLVTAPPAATQLAMAD